MQRRHDEQVRDLFTCPVDQVDIDAVRDFVATAIAERLQAESLMLEFKRQNDGNNVIYAVAAMANTDGGLVIVGVDENADDPIVGIDAARHDSIVRSLRALVPDAMPEVIPAAVPDTDILVMVLRVVADAAIHPVVVEGRVMKRVPGQSVGARRDEIVALCGRPTSPTPMAMAGSRSGLPDMTLWEDSPDSTAESSAEIRSRAAIVLPERLRTRGYLGSAAIGAAAETLAESPLPGLVIGEQTSPSSPLKPVSWECTEFSSLRADFASQRSTAGVPWRPQLSAVGRVALRERLLDLTLSVIPASRDKDRPIVNVAELHDVLLASLHTSIAAGQAAAAAIGADRPMQPPIVDAAVRNVLGTGRLSLGTLETRLTRQAPPQGWWLLPGRPAEATDILGLDALVKDWLHVPLFEFGMLDFEETLKQLPLPRWAQSLI